MLLRRFWEHRAQRVWGLALGDNESPLFILTRCVWLRGLPRGGSRAAWVGTDARQRRAQVWPGRKRSRIREIFGGARRSPGSRSKV